MIRAVTNSKTTVKLAVCQREERRALLCMNVAYSMTLRSRLQLSFQAINEVKLTTLAGEGHCPIGKRTSGTLVVVMY
jgi:hypothetical protein